MLELNAEKESKPVLLVVVRYTIKTKQPQSASFVYNTPDGVEAGTGYPLGNWFLIVPFVKTQYPAG